MESVSDSLATIEQYLTPDDESRWAIAMGLLGRSEITTAVRKQLLLVLLSKARSPQMPAFCTLGTQLAERLHNDNFAETELVDVMVARFDNSDFQDSVLSERTTIEFLGRVVNFGTPMIGVSSQQKAWRAMARVRRPRSEIQEVVVDAILSAPKMDNCWPEMVPLIDDVVKQRLRLAVRDTEPPHGLALAALSHLGDVEIRPELEKRRGNPTEQVKMNRSIWKIDAQNPKEKLLEKIRKLDEIGGPVGQRWALRRAVELGVEKRLVREAVLAFASNAPSTDNPNKRRPHSSVIDLKDLAQELQILEPGDLPEVPKALKSK